MQVITNFKNFDMSFTYPENLGLTISTEPEYNYYIQDFGTFDLGGILKGKYNVDYISDIYFKLDGANTINVEGETTTIPVILTANYTMEVHKTVNDKEVEWSIENPLTGETITHTGLMTFAVQNNTHYYVTNTETGEVYDLVVGGDNAGVSIDVGTGEIKYTETAKNSGGDNIYEIPQTADLSPVAVGVSVVGVLGATGFIVYKKKRKKDDDNNQDNTNLYDEI